ncbi:MAG TPA: hypothetical protein VGS61_00105 [Acidimicrobiales bacterium]|nr:hypothetical protein [Acidimicrobiales bacterium]
MAKSTTGKWVTRVGAAGGGKAYRTRRFENFYGILAVIVILGGAATVWARYNYEHPHHAQGTPPTVGTTWYAALAINVCGKAVPFLNSDPSAPVGFHLLSDNVIQIKPTSAADAGSHATVAQFGNEYPALVISGSQIAIGTATGAPNAKTTYINGNACKAGTKYAGQTGKVSYLYWRSFGQATPTVTTNPASIKFSPYLRLTMSFNPVGVTAAPPTKTTTDQMYLYGSSAPTTTTPVLSTTTTGPGTPPTTGAPTTTTTG